MTKQKIAEVIETAPVRLTSDETRLILRLAQSGKPVKISGWNMGRSLMDLGLVEEIEIETRAELHKRRALLVKELERQIRSRNYTAASDLLAKVTKGCGCSSNDEPEPEKGLALTEVGRQVARGITVRLGKRA